jgi:hypothetical protein
MGASAFVTKYEILRANDYVIITFSSPSGEVADGRLKTDEVARLAMTIPSFIDFVRTASQLADRAAEELRPKAAAVEPPKEPRSESAADEPLRELVVRH